jgi:large subunit ribosomal protein L13
LRQQDVERNWVLVDAKGQTLGRLASRIAFILRGKHKPGFTPHVDCGDKVVVINAEQVHLTGKKWDQKAFTWHTGYTGGQRKRTARQTLNHKPERLIERAVKNMLPKNRLGRRQFHNMFVYAGSEHKHEAQNPQPIELKV